MNDNDPKDRHEVELTEKQYREQWDKATEALDALRSHFVATRQTEYVQGLVNGIDTLQRIGIRAPDFGWKSY